MTGLFDALGTTLGIMPVWTAATLIWGFCVVMLWSVKTLLMLGGRNVARRTRFFFDTVLMEAARGPANIVVVVLALWTTRLVMQAFELVERTAFVWLNVLCVTLLVLAVILFMDRLSRLSLEHFQARSSVLKTSGQLIKGTVRIFIFAIGALVILSTLGISITPVIASLGIGSLAVALALQPTLENFFSGLQIVADKPVRVGDFIELESGEQGFVEQIGWRSVWVKMLPNNIVIVPNSVLAKSKIINYYYPEKQLSVPVECSVHYDSDLDKVERVALEEARKILTRHEWGVDDYETFVIFTKFDSSSINFTVMLRAKEYFNRFFIKSAFIKALHTRFKQEGIVIPYPIQAINLSQEQRQQHDESHICLHAIERRKS